MGLHHAQQRHCPDGRVHGIAAALQDLQRRERRIGMGGGRHAAGAESRRPPWPLKIAHVLKSCKKDRSDFVARGRRGGKG
jgi:hypothetical protein